MVYTGKPSRGCEVCRKRRIKCDEAEPSCSYCAGKNIPCPGYKSAFDLAWRDQNVVAERSVQRRKNANERAAERFEDNKQQLQLFHDADIPRVLAQDRAGYALNFFFSFYICLPKDDVQRGLFDCLYPIWQKTDAVSPLRPIVTAVASVMLDAWSQLKPYHPFSISRSQYTQGVAALRKSLETADHATDEIIMAALMLDMYESLTSFLTAQRNKGLHMSGTTALIQSRRKKPMADETSQLLVLGIRNQLVGRALSGADAVPSVVSTWSDATADIAMTPSFHLDALNIEVANLQALAAKLPTIDNAIRRENLAARIYQRAIELDQALTSWAENVPADWIPIRVSDDDCIPPSVRSAGLYQPYCDIYKSVFVAHTFNGYYTSHLILHVTILAALSHLPSSLSLPPTTHHHHHQTQIQHNADLLCATLPFHLGDRQTFHPITSTSVLFPHAPGRPTPEGHHTAAAAFAAFYLCTHLPKLLAPGVVLRAGQKAWVGGQLGRIRRVSNVDVAG